MLIALKMFQAASGVFIVFFVYFGFCFFQFFFFFFFFYAMAVLQPFVVTETFSVKAGWKYSYPTFLDLDGNIKFIILYSGVSYVNNSGKPLNTWFHDKRSKDAIMIYIDYFP